MSLRDLPIPVFTFEAYEQLIPLVKALEAGSISQEGFFVQSSHVLMSMPVEHSHTLAYLLELVLETNIFDKTNKQTSKTAKTFTHAHTDPST